MRLLPVALLAVLAAVLLPTSASADLGDLDPSFGAGGIAYPLPGESGYVLDLAPLADGGAYALIGFDYNATGSEVVKITAAGALDTTWSEDGRAAVGSVLPAGNGQEWIMRSLAVTADGAVYVGGTQLRGPLSSTGRFAVLRLGQSGAPDFGFDGDGVATYVGDYDGYDGHAVAPFGNEDADDDAEGVVIVGQANISTNDASLRTIGAVAFDSDGTTNTTFDTVPGDASVEGLAWIGDTPGVAHDVAIDAAGRVVVAGYGARAPKQGYDESVWAVARWDADGTPDASFGDDLNPDPAVVEREGIAYGDPASPGGDARLHELQLVGTDVYVGGYASAADESGEFAIARYDSTGTLDPTWGTSGVATARLDGQVDGTTAEIQAFVVEPTGAVVAGGWASNAGGSSAAIGFLRFDEDGAEDEVFRGGGSFFGETYGGVSNRLGGAMLVAGKPVFVGMTNGVYPGDESEQTHYRPTVLRLSNVRSAPTNAGAPQLSGNGVAKQGDTLSVTDGAWSGYGSITYEYAWERCSASKAQGAWSAGTPGCTIVAGTSNSRALIDADVDMHVRAIVTAVNDAELETPWASNTQFVGAVAPTSKGRPVLAPNRDVSVGETLQVTDENFTGTNLTYEYHWMSCATANPPHFPAPDPCQYLAAFDQSYTVAPEEAGRHLRVYVVASNSAGSAFSYSATRAVGGTPVTGTAPARTADPTIDPAGPVTEGDTLTMTSPGTYSGTPAPGLARQWQRCGGTASAPTGCAAISGATGETYTTTGADAGKVVRLRVIADNGAGTATGDSSGRDVKEKPAAPRVERPAPPSGGGTGGGASGPRPVSTQSTKSMPNVVGKTADEAVELIARAGIYADVNVDPQARKKALTLKGKQLDPGQVFSQSTGAGTPVASSIGSKHRVRLVVEAGPKGIKACQNAEFRRELKGIDLEETWKLLEEKDCDGRVNLNFKVAGSADEPEVQAAAKDGRELRVTVVVPRNPAEFDLFPSIGQGARLQDAQPSFGADDWGLTADVDNVFGITVYDRYIGDTRKNIGARTVIGAQVYVDGDSVGMEDVVRKTREDTGSRAIFGRFTPKRAGTVRFLVQAQDAVGNKIFGFGQFPVKQRSGKFSTIIGETYDVRGSSIARVGRAAGGPVARAASVDQLWRWVQGLLTAAPVQQLGRAASNAGEGLIGLAKQSAGAVQFTLGNVASNAAQLIQMRAANVVAAGGANVVSAGGANVVAAGGANVVAAGGLNLIGQAGGNVVAAGGLNLLGSSKLISGTGSMRAFPSDTKLISENGLGLISDNGLGLQSASKVIAPSEGAPVVAAGGLNLIGTASGNVVAAGGLN